MISVTRSLISLSHPCCSDVQSEACQSGRSYRGSKGTHRRSRQYVWS